jgi:hypothetical protein
MSNKSSGIGKIEVDYMTTNKSNRDVNKQFDQKDFNKKFEDNERVIEKERKFVNADDVIQQHHIIDKNLPHKKPVEDVIINIREMFYKILEMLIDKQNPIPYIFSSPDRHFAFAILLIIIGTLLLLFSNLMMSNSNNKNI